jgi:2-polyprenyl-6-methoxyphenol hydroxylase-like FAD-dependent oxidoreductase
VIVGGGPVGLMLALFLDEHNVPCVVFNRESSTRWHPKGNTHNSRTMEHYRCVGISPAVRKLGLPFDYPRDIAYFTRLNGWELARIALPSEEHSQRIADEAPETDQVPEPLLRANQMYVERYMLEHASTRKNITLRFGWSVTEFSQDERGVSIKAVETRGEGSTERWRADYLAGCDGGQSFVRERLGIRYVGHKGTSEGFLNGKMFSSHVRIPNLHRDILGGKKAWMYNMMARGSRMLLISLDGADEFLLMTQAATADDAPDDVSVIRRVREGIGSDLEVVVLAHAAWHGGVALVAESFSEGRIYLAGDAIHLFSPTGGFGMNTGIDGAANLAWKIAASVQGWAGDGLLASYEHERRPVATRNTVAAQVLTQRVSGVTAPPELESAGADGDLARRQFGGMLQSFRTQFTSLGVELGARYDGSPIVWSDGEPPLDDPLVYRPSTVPGGRLPHVWITRGVANRLSVFDLLNTGFTLQRIGGNPPSGERFSGAAHLLGIPFQIIRIPSEKAHQLYQCELLLVRPDQHIAWRGHEIPGDVTAVLRRAVGHV